MKTLIKGENVNITRENPTLKILEVQLEHSTQDKELYDETEFGAILCDENNKALQVDTLIYFNNMDSTDQEVTFTGDDQTTYKILIDLDKIPKNIEIIDIISWINNENKRFRQLKTLKIHIKDHNKNQNLLTIDSLEDANGECKALITIKIYRYRGDWKVRAVNDGWVDGMKDVVKEYGINGED